MKDIQATATRQARRPRGTPQPAAQPTCRLVISLFDGKTTTDYVVRPIEPGWHEKAFQIRKLGDSPALYHVTQATDGSTTCDCPSGEWRPERACRHRRALVACGLLAPAPVVPDQTAGRRFAEGL